MLNKHQIRISLAADFGEHFTKLFNAAEQALHRSQGKAEEAKKLAASIASLSAIVERSLDAGEFDNLNGLEVAKKIKGFLTRAVALCEQGQSSAIEEVVIQRGKTMALDHAINHMQNSIQGEQNKIKSIEAAAEADAEVKAGPRAAGVHPGKRIKEQRKEEGEKKAVEAKPKPKRRRTRKKKEEDGQDT